MNVVREISKINEQELKHGITAGSGASWHDKYRDSAWVYVGGLDYGLTEGDVLCVMSQWGEVEDINMVRDQATGKSKGFVFLKYEDHKSTILAVDNFNGIQLLGRTLRVDHVEHYKLPKHVRERESEAFEVNPAHEVRIGAGHAYDGVELASDFNIGKGMDLWAPAAEAPAAAEAAGRAESDSERSETHGRSDRKDKKKKKDKKHKDKKSKREKRSRDAEEFNREYERRYAELGAKTRAPAVLTGEERHGNSDMEVAALLAGGDQPRMMSAMDGGSLSWRGQRDPTLAASRLAEQRRKMRGEEVPTRREEHDMYGGYKRRR